MYKSLKSWMTCHFTVQHYLGMSAAADRLYSDPEEFLGYYTGQVQVVNTSTAREVSSASQVYFDPTKVDIDEDDRITVDGKTHDVLTVTSYMDGNTGTSSVKIAYL